MKDIKFSKDVRHIIDEGGKWKIKSHIVESVMTKFGMVGKGTSDSEYIRHRGSHKGYKNKIAEGYVPDYTHHKILGVQESHNGRSETVKRTITRNFQVEELKNGKLKNVLESNEIGNNDTEETEIPKVNLIESFKELWKKGLTASKIILYAAIGAFILIAIWVIAVATRR